MKISVVMAVYNGAARLATTLDSILTQTEQDLEVITVDDGSTDGTAAILDQASSSDTRVRVIHQGNQGLTRSLITGCAAARAPYIARHDAGDWSDAQRFEKQRRALDADASLAFVSCATEFVGPEGESLYVTRGTGRADRPIRIIDLESPTGVQDGPSSHPSVMFRTDAYFRAGGYRDAFHYGQDWDLWYRLAEQGAFQLIDEVLYHAVFELNTISASARPAQQLLAALSLEALKVRAAGGADEEILRRARDIRSADHSRRGEAKALYFIGELLRRREDPKARAYLWKAIRSNPAHAKSWLRLVQSLLS